MDTKQVVGRLAPSPTGDLHLGHARTALVAWLASRSQGGRFILRMEDLDAPRTLPGADQRIMKDLRWMGLDWDEGPDRGGPVGPYHQSERLVRYAKALEALHAKGLIYGCTCSRADLARAASAPHAGEEGPVYPGWCREKVVPPDFDAGHDPRIRRPSWRFRVPQRTITFVDEIAGPQVQHLASEVGDFVLRRADGLFAYQLAVVLDDMDMGVNLVVRGADLLSSTPRQMVLWQALGQVAWPRYAHVPLVVDASGRRLAKRDGSASLASMRAQGLTPTVLVGRLAHSLGLQPDDAPTTPEALLSGFSLEGLAPEPWRLPQL